MADPFIGEIRTFSFGLIPKGWLPCNGQILPIAQNQALFALLSTQYGGNGVTTFALPNLQGRAMIHRSSSYAQGSSGGEATHTLSVGEIPQHTHVVSATSAAASTSSPSSGVMLAQSSGASLYGSAANSAGLAANAIGNVGGQAHENRQPYLGMNVCISTSGIFPPRN